MIHLTTEDGRALMYNFSEHIPRLQFMQGLGEKIVNAGDVEVGDWIRIRGRGKREDRKIDLAMVTKIQRINP